MATFLHVFRKYLSPPIFQDEEQTRRAKIVHVIHLGLILASLAGILGELTREQYGLETTATLLIAIVLTIIPYQLNRRGHSNSAGFILLTIMLAAVTALLLIGNGIHDIAITALPVLLIISALMLNRWGVYIFTIFVIFVTGFVVFAELNKLTWTTIAFPISTSYSDFFIVATILAIAAVSSHFLIDQLVTSLIRARLSDARIRALVGNSPDTILEIDRNRKIVFINRFTEIYLGKHVREALPADQVDFALEVIDKVFTSGEPQAVELQTIAPDGHVSWDSIRLGPVKQGEEISSLTIIMTEITAQKLAEASLRESEANYRGAIIAAGFVPYSIDYQKKYFTFIGEDVYKLTGYTAQEITPILLKESIQEEYLWGPNAGMTANEARQKILSGTPLEWRQDMLIQTKNGENRWLSDTSIEILDTNGRAIGGIGIFQDITERKQAEAEREKLFKELAAQNAELERFNYTISHELKSPIVTIKGFVGRIEKNLHNENIENVKKDLKRVASAADSMQETLHDLLELSRVGRFINTFEEVDLFTLVQEALENTKGRIRKKHISINVAQNLPTIFADRVRLREALENLIDNAAKYMGEQKNPLIEIGARHDNEWVIFIKDNGMGIDPQYTTKIFGLFEKLDATSEGTGIGLTLIKRIVEMHGGRIWVESAGIGMGSTFFFTIPDHETIKDKP